MRATEGGIGGGGGGWGIGGVVVFGGLGGGSGRLKSPAGHRVSPDQGWPNQCHYHISNTRK